MKQGIEIEFIDESLKIGDTEVNVFYSNNVIARAPIFLAAGNTFYKLLQGS